MNGPIVWLASYPKSGNTWVRALLGAYTAETAESIDINQLGSGPIASSLEVFDELLGVSAADLTMEEIERYRPGVYVQRAAALSAPAFIKVHDAFTLTVVGEPLFPLEVACGVVYVVRNPLDIAASFAFHGGTSIDTSIDRLCSESFIMSKSKGAAADQLPQRLGSWSSHVRSWLDESGLRTLVVRYEDLHDDAVSVLRQIAEFSGLPLDEARLEGAASAASFDRLQAQEASAGFRERATRATAPFFRKGQVGSWRTELSEAQSARIVDAHAPTMRRFGYLQE